MALDPMYGTGVYNARLPKVDISLPRLASGVATPLAFFPSTPSTNTATDDLESALDTSLQDIIAMGSTGYTDRNGVSPGTAGGSSYGGVRSGDGGTGATTSGTTPGGRISGLGLPGAVASVGGTAISTGLSMAGAPGIVAGTFGKLSKGLLGDGMTETDMANLAINTAVIALGVPGVALSALNVLGFNPAQGIGEAAGLYKDLTPGFEGGFFGTQGIGSGLSLGEGSGIGQSNAGADSNGSGVSVGSGGGLSYGGSTATSDSRGDSGGGGGGSTTNTGGTPGYGAGDLGSGISVGAGGGVDTSGLSNSESGNSDSGGGGSGGGKIVCTAMNETYGFGSYRNAIWLAYAAKNLTPYHEKGYHAIFLPLVKYGFKSGDGRCNRFVRHCLEWYARRRSADLRKEMQGKNPSPIFRLVRRFSEFVCYLVGRCCNSAPAKTKK